ncbi:MAG: 16S rRNA (uracil(1498)-N(3))-methyltransferase [Christensenellales bacterium]|jgi:16S rRNA (uracil1498-N3)-methyltransferase
MHRFFVNIQQFKGDFCEISGSDAGHISRVLRLEPFDRVVVCDGFGSEYLGEIRQIGETVRVALLEKLESNAEPSCRVTLYQGLPKQDKMDFIVQKCVELGIFAVQPVETRRCVVKGANTKKWERWNKIAREAAKQSGRGIVPEVLPLLPFDRALDGMGEHELLVVCYENETQRGLLHLLQGQRDIGLVIGPEGGLERSEVEALCGIGGQTITLGRRILRTETAGMAVLSGLMFHMGEMGGVL